MLWFDWRPRVWPCVFALALGIALSLFHPPLAWGWGLLATGLLVLLWGLTGARATRQTERWAAPVWALATVLACFGLGLLRGESCQRVGPHDISHWVRPEAQLTRVLGVLLDAPQPTPPLQGAWAGFDHPVPVEHFQLRLKTLETDHGPLPVEGVLAVTREAGGAELKAGDQVTLLGWLSALHGPLNPGEFDMRAHLRQKGVAASLFAHQAAARQMAPWWSRAHWREKAAAQAQMSLRAGLHAGQPRRTTLIGALLLGVRGGEGQAELWRDFQQAGLAHLLAISGANVGIFLLGVWWLGRLVCGRPGRVACVVVAVVGLFLLAVPDEMPVLRAGLMAVLLAGAYGLGRPVSGLFALGVSALVLLLWHPLELLAPGFQLTFAAVGALFLFTRPLADGLLGWLTGRMPLENAPKMTLGLVMGRKCLRLAVEGAAACVVVFVAVLPVLMLHFDAISPLAALFSMLAAPLAFLMMWVGYLKIVLGLLCAPLGGALACPLEWCADALAAVVHWAAHWPGAQVALVRPASAGAGLLALGLIWGALGLAIRRWRWVPIGLLTLALGLLAFEQVWAWHALRSPPGLRLHALAVGDGSCFVLETSQRALLFDCGSRTRAQVGARVAVPALRRLGVRSLDAIIVSHADLDHFGGMLEVADAMPVRAAYLGPSVLAEAQADAKSTSGVLVAGLKARGIACHPILRGWRMELGPQTAVEALWPTAQTAPTDSRNNQSVVLRAACANHRVLLSADLEALGMQNLFKIEKDLKAEVADLPHHGGFVAQSPQWFKAVSPGRVIQSSSLERLAGENSQQWTPLLKQAQVKRQVTGQEGWISIQLAP